MKKVTKLKPASSIRAGREARRNQRAKQKSSPSTKASALTLESKPEATSKTEPSSSTQYPLPLPGTTRAEEARAMAKKILHSSPLSPAGQQPVPQPVLVTSLPPVPSQPESAPAQPKAAEASVPKALQTESLSSLPPPVRGVDALTCYGTKVHVIDFLPGFKDMVLVRVLSTQDGFRAEMQLRDLQDSDELWRWVTSKGHVMPLEATLPDKDEDCYGITFKEAVAQQEAQLIALEAFMDDVTYLRLRRWCEKTNKPCLIEVRPTGPKHGPHEVARGQQIFNWLLERGQLLNNPTTPAKA